MADKADIMVDTQDIPARYRREADTADILAQYRHEADTADSLARYRHEADTSSAEAARNSSAAHREHIETGEAETGAVVTGAAATGAAAVTDPSLSADLVTRTTGVGAILTRTRTSAIILTGTILRMRTIMTIAPYQEGDSLAPDPPPVILFNHQPSHFTLWRLFVSFHGYHSLKSPSCSCVSITLPAAS